MSLVFPSPSAPNSGWTWPIKKAPAYATLIQTPVSGRSELRIAQQLYPRWQFELDVSYLQGSFADPTSALAELAGFYMAVQGRASDWLFLDPEDNVASAMPFGTGDGSTTAFQLTRQLTNGAPDIVQNLYAPPTIAVAGVTQPTSGYSIGSTGLVTFTSAPASGAALTWSGNFYFRCRFSEDTLGALQEDLYGVWSAHGLKFQSVIL